MSRAQLDIHGDGGQEHRAARRASTVRRRPLPPEPILPVSQHRYISNIENSDDDHCDEEDERLLCSASEKLLS